jgi:hypothetical protein
MTLGHYRLFKVIFKAIIGNNVSLRPIWVRKVLKYEVVLEYKKEPKKRKKED